VPQFCARRRENFRRLYDGLRRWEDRLSGNILRQPGFRSSTHRVAGELTVSDTVMNDTFFLGVYPGLTVPMLDYVVESFDAFFRR
jgi:dTDP-4-amino-4,6-dideoxygalactose transaminase